MACPSSTSFCHIIQSATYHVLSPVRIAEAQASACCRRHPATRIASLRFHMAKDGYDDAWPVCLPEGLWGWVSYEACARACVLGLRSEGWHGHEVFHIAADEICWEGGLTEASMRKPGEVGVDGHKVAALDLLDHTFPGTEVVRDWWGPGRARRGFYDCSKAERLLGWRHDG